MVKQKFQHITHDRKHPAYIVAWLGFVVGVIVSIWGIIYAIHPFFAQHSPYKTWYANLWFNHFQQFTIQTNTLLVIFYGIWLFRFKSKVMQSNTFLIFCTSWIILVCVVAWFMMTAVFSINGSSQTDIYKILDHVLVHTVTVIIFLVFFRYAVGYPKATKRKEIKYAKTLYFAAIYPVLYFTYAIIINFIPLSANVFSNPDASGNNHFISVYASLTNYNPRCIVPELNGGVWSYDNQSCNAQGDPVRLIIVPFVIGFYSLELLIICYLNNRANVFRGKRQSYI